MQKITRSIAALTLVASLASAGRAACVTASTAWNNTAFTAQTAAFTATFQMVPGAAKIDSVAGLSAASATDFSSLAAAVRFNSAGTIDARNGGAYAAVASVPYAAGVAYSFRMSVDPVAHRYSAWVTPAGGAERQIASSYAFRTEQALTSQLANLGLIADTGSDQLCGFLAAGAAATADTTPPVVSIGAPAAGATLTGSATLTGTASDNVGVASVEVAVDAGAYAPASGTSSWSYVLNTTALTNASHTVTVRAKDLAGNTAWNSRGFVVSNIAPAPAGTCQASVVNTWKNTAMPAQTGSFTAAFDAIPAGANLDAVTGFSNAAATDFSSLAAIVRFNNTGTIDARNGGAYAAAASLPYAAGQTYKVRLFVEPALHRYSAWVTPPSGSEQVLGQNYAFRTEQASVSSIANLALGTDSGTHQVCNVSVVPAAIGDTTPPSVAITAPAAGATMSGASAKLAAAASDNVGVVGVQFLVDGAPVDVEDTTSPYGATWDTTKARDGAHVVTAVARDAAGNKTTSAAVNVTVSNAVVPPPTTAGTDRFGVKMLYQTLSGGKNWVSKWDTGTPRTFNGVDPADAWFDAAHGDATFNVDGNGQFSISGPVPRMYVHDPAKQDQWRNVEVTVYAKRVSDQGTPWGGVVVHARANHGTTGDENVDKCDTRGVGARLRYDGGIDFEKETNHPDSTAVASKPAPGGFPFNKWIGYKYVIYDQADGTVKLEMYLDQTDGANGGTWTKVNEFVDDGSNFGGSADCKSGVSSYLKLTNAGTRTGSESGKPNITVYLRSDDVGTDGLVYKRLSVREITPTAAAAPAGR